MSRAKALGVSEVNKRAARAAWDGMDLRVSELGFLLRLFLVIRNFLLEEKGKGFIGHLVVLGVGGESRNLVPKKLEQSKGLAVEAIASVWFRCYVCL